MVVVDASVIAKTILPWEEGRDKTKRILQRHIDKEDQIIVPDLLFYEVANILATRTTIPLKKVQSSIKELYKIDLQVHHPSETNMLQAAKLAKERHLSVYDAVYAVLAKEKKCPLITADEKFVETVKLPFVKNLKDY